MANIETALEMARCAEINLQNLGKVTPGLQGLPFFQIVEAQIKDCIDALEKEGDDDGSE